MNRQSTPSIALSQFELLSWTPANYPGAQKSGLYGPHFLPMRKASGGSGGGASASALLYSEVTVQGKGGFLMASTSSAPPYCVLVFTLHVSTHGCSYPWPGHICAHMLINVDKHSRPRNELGRLPHRFCMPESWVQCPELQGSLSPSRVGPYSSITTRQIPSVVMLHLPILERKATVWAVKGGGRFLWLPSPLQQGAHCAELGV